MNNNKVASMFKSVNDFLPNKELKIRTMFVCPSKLNHATLLIIIIILIKLSFRKPYFNSIDIFDGIFIISI